MTKESFDLLNSGKELYNFFYENIEKINLNKYKISLWDCGFGVSLMIISGIYFNYYFFIISSILFGFITILFILFISKRIDKNMNSNSIILAGVVISLFFSSIMSFFAYAFPKYSNQIIFWQLGNLFVRNYFDIFIIILLTIIFLIVLVKNANILDIMTFGDKESMLLGVNPKKARILFY